MPRLRSATTTHGRNMAGEGVTDFTPYRVDPSVPLMPDFFVPEQIKPPEGVKGGV